AREECFPAPEAVVQTLRLALGLQLPSRGLRPDDELERDFVVDRQAGERPEDVRQGLSLEGRADREVIAPCESEFGDADITAPPGAIVCWQELERRIRRAQLRFDEDAFAGGHPNLELNLICPRRDLERDPGTVIEDA